MQVSYCRSDMQILPETPQERKIIIQWAKDRGLYNTVSFQSYVSNVKGQDWYGKRFYEIAFDSYRYYDLLEYLNIHLESEA